MSKQIQLTQEQIAIVDDEDYEYLNQWKPRELMIKELQLHLENLQI